MRSRFLQGDCLEVLKRLESNSVDLVFGSPPYEDARLYGKIGFKLTGQDWVDWAVPRFEACLRVCKGLVVWVIQGKTRGYRWSCTPALFMADLHRRGVKLRNPPIFHRVGIPGSGGSDWLRSDYEWIVCATRDGGRLPWSDNLAMGHPPKWAPGGEMSHRLTSGARVNQWGGRLKRGVPARNKDRVVCVGRRPSHREVGSDGRVNRPRKAERRPDGHRDIREYKPSKVANPGNVILCSVGGGKMGSKEAHKNVAPFPEKLVLFFVKSFCLPKGIVLDPFSGSGTAAAVAVKLGRKFIAVDLDPRMIELTRKRVREAREKMGLLLDA